jgi:SAM-dependent methyltransferase
MPEAPLSRADAGLTDPDSLFRQTHDEHARTRFTQTLLNHAMVNLRFETWEVYEKAVKPAFEKAHGRAPKDGKEILDALHDSPFFRVYSAFRYNAQEMGPLSVQPAVERAAPQFIDAVRDILAHNDTKGTLRLDPAMRFPKYMTGLDAHLTPGGYWSEYADDDVTQAMLLQGRRIAGPVVNAKRDFGNVGLSVGTWISRRFPGFRPRRVLDMATQEGKNLLAYGRVFPGAELYGADIAAPSLRYGHAKAILVGVDVHFSQQNCEQTDFPDGHFDLIVSSFFLHEISVPATKRVLKECFRLLAPGGIVAHMELPPHKTSSALLNATFDWDARYNNEPHYSAFRSQDYTALLTEAGFDAARSFEIEVPDVGSFPPEKYDAFLRGEAKAPPHGRGGWFVFGARKQG